ncbi:Alpha/Beta hydrolase protein [Mycena pura]|uniref:Alpha/Beta hydrolase protein n=1 Tax=Mycena pura TaxID=153505 RepID=A0AAD6VDY1_9AGAR|nr:Alpha/Beta hydrolase protein [Mycena pura]
MSSPAYTESWRTGPEGTEFYTRLYKAPDPLAILVFVHGAAEHCGRYTEMHTKLAAEHRISVFAFDLRGFGRTAADTEHKSPDSAYGRTWWPEQLDDLEWAILEANQELGEALPLFTMGTSQGGGVVVGLHCDPARANNPAVKTVHGVIGGSTTVVLAKPLSGPLKWIFRQLVRVSPWMVYPIRNKTEELSRNPESGKAYNEDPLIRTPGSLKGLYYMLEEGGMLLASRYANWPKDLPVLFLHGDADPIVSYSSTKALFDKLPATDKKFIAYKGGYHELHFEPDGIKEKSMKNLVEFIHSHP